jgi:hypothetical protein
MLRPLLAAPLALILAVPAVGLAQERHAVPSADLAAAVARQAAAQDAARAEIRDALARPEVREVAARAGVDVEQLAAAAATLTGASLERTADAARQVNQTLAGGASTIVISTTTIIIVLLVLLLIVVAVD